MALNYNQMMLLINKNIVLKNIEVTIEEYKTTIDKITKVKSFYGYTVDDIIITDNNIMLYLTSLLDGTKKYSSYKNIVLIDGMELDRIFETYDMTMDGEKIFTGKKRGRKSKSMLV